jgi:hypothetical protein
MYLYGCVYGGELVHTCKCSCMTQPTVCHQILTFLRNMLGIFINVNFLDTVAVYLVAFLWWWFVILYFILYLMDI